MVGPNVKVTNDSSNADGGLGNVTPSRTRRTASQTRPRSRSTIGRPHRSPAESATSSPRPRTTAGWCRTSATRGSAIYLSFDGGTTWAGAPGFPQRVPDDGARLPQPTHVGRGPSIAAARSRRCGRPSDPLRPERQLARRRDRVQRDRDPGERPLGTVGFVARYRYTPGTPATASTTTTPGNLPHFTYAGTAIVDRSAVGFAVTSRFAGNFTDKPWMEVDLNSPSASPCSGNVYYADTNFHGQQGSSPVTFSRFERRRRDVDATARDLDRGAQGASHNQGADIAVAANGTIYVAFESFSSQGVDTINFVKSTDCGQHWSRSRWRVNTIDSSQAPGVAFRTPTFAFLATDTTNSNVVYIAYQNLVAGDATTSTRSARRTGASFGPPVQVNTDVSPPRHQVFPTIEVSHGTQASPGDFRNSVTPTNEAFDVYYSCTNCNGVSWPTFDAPTRVTNVSAQPGVPHVRRRHGRVPTATTTSSTPSGTGRATSST